MSGTWTRKHTISASALMKPKHVRQPTRWPGKVPAGTPSASGLVSLTMSKYPASMLCRRPGSGQLPVKILSLRKVLFKLEVASQHILHVRSGDVHDVAVCIGQ